METPYTIAIEVELSQKSQFRIERKFIDYTEEAAHTYALYITKKKSLFENYWEVLTSMDQSIQKSIILSLAEKLGCKQYDFQKAIYWFNGKKYSFDALFGGEEKPCSIEHQQHTNKTLADTNRHQWHLPPAAKNPCDSNSLWPSFRDHPLTTS